MIVLYISYSLDIIRVSKNFDLFQWITHLMFFIIRNNGWDGLRVVFTGTTLKSEYAGLENVRFLIRVCKSSRVRI